MKGKLIVLEGPEGGGKTTQAERLIKRLEQAGHNVKTWREPGGTVLGEYIRDILKHDAAGECPTSRAELFLFEAARAQIVEKLIDPALEAGNHVVLDRFYDSTTAYQGYGRGMDPNELYDLHMIATGGLEPDISILLDIDAAFGLNRVRGRNMGLSDRFDDERLEFHQRVAKGYREIASGSPRNWVVIDASQTVEQVEEQIWKYVSEQF